MTHTITTAEVQGSEMEIFHFRPDGEGPHPGVILCQHIPVAHAGLETDPWQLDAAARLAAMGYAVAMPFMFHWWPKSDGIEVKREAFRDDWAVADLAAARAALEADADVDADRIAIVGHCWGGRSAWLGACHDPALKAAVTLYGGRIHLAFADGGTPPIELAGAIPCPVLGIFGNEDQNPSPDQVDALDRALDAAGVTHEFHRYDGAGHGFQDWSNAERYRQALAEDAWGKIEEFLARTLAA